MSTFSDEWAALQPRPEWDKPEHWAAARPEAVKAEQEEAEADG